MPRFSDRLREVVTWRIKLLVSLSRREFQLAALENGKWNPSPEFLQYFETICLKWKAFDLSNKIGNILWLVALLEAFEINKTMVIILTAILDFTKN